MSDDLNKKVVIEAELKGNPASVFGELLDIVDRLGVAFGLPQDLLEKFSKGVIQLAQASSTGKQGAQALAHGLDEVQRSAIAAENALKDLVAENIRAGGMGDPSKQIGKVDPSDVKAAQQMANFDGASVVAAQKEVERQSAALEKALENVNRAFADQSWRQSLEGLTALEAAEMNYLRALEQEEQALSRVQASEGADKGKQVEAANELAKATDRVTAARARFNSEKEKKKTKDDNAELKAVNDLEKAEARLAKSREKLERGAGSNTGTLKVAREQATKATLDLANAELDLAAAQAKGDPQAQIAATNAMTAATEEYARAAKHVETTSSQIINKEPRLRYALYDISRTLTVASGAMLGFASSAGVVATSMSRDFADVIRTTETFMDGTGRATERLRGQFQDLYKSMPTDWSSLTELGSMAGQMNIASEDVARFSGLVTMFTASTSVGVEEAATAFGRLSALLNVSADEYENLGSSILSAGVNSVATESQIINISQQIAGISGTAGLAAEEVIGLSSALASIGVAPELARGMVTRVFTGLISSVAEGGEKLDAFARAAKMTAEDFAKAWTDRPMEAFQALIKGIGELEGAAQIQALRDIGISSIRDLPNILKLAQSYDLLADSMNIASEGYTDGTALADHYGVIAEELSSKIQVLKNNFALLLESLGAVTQTDFFKGLVDGLSRAVELLTTLTDSGIGKVMVVLGVGIMGVVGALGLFVAGLIAFRGGMSATKTAMVQLAVTMKAVQSESHALMLTNRQLVASFKSVEMGARAARIALAATGAGLAFTVAIASLAKFVEKLGETKRAAEDLRQVMAGLTDAVKADTDAYNAAVDANSSLANSYRVIETESERAEKQVGKLGNTSIEMTDALAKILGVTAPVKDGLDGVADSADRATIALGKEFAMGLANALTENKEFLQGLSEADTALADVGFTLADFGDAAAAGLGVEYLDPFIKQLKELAHDDSLKAFADDAHELDGSLDAALKTLENMRAGVEGTDAAVISANETLALGNELLGGAADAADEAAEAFRELSESPVSGMFDDLIGSTYDIQGAMYDLAETLIKNGGAWDKHSEEGRSSMAALESALEDLWAAGDGSIDFANNIANAMAFVEGAEIDLGDQTQFLYGIMAETFNSQWGLSLDTTAAHASIKTFLDSVVAALKARAEIERSALARIASTPLDNWAASTGFDYRDDQHKYHSGNLAAINEQISSVSKLASGLGAAGDAGRNAGKQIRKSLGGGGGGGGGGKGGGPKKAAKDVKDLQEEIRTLGDYAKDLSGIWNRAFEIRFSAQQTFDSITTSVRDVAERFQDAADRVRDLRLQLQTLQGDLTGLKAELSKQEYFLSIAVEYGDTARAEQIQARIAELQGEIAVKQKDVTDTSKNLKKATEDTSRSLVGNSDAAIQNRRDLESLVSEYQNHVEALANSGMGADDLKKKVEALRQDFIKEATQLGFNRTELKKYENGFKDMKVAIDNVPRNITVKANTNPAMQAVNEFLAGLKKKSGTMNVNAKVNAPKSLGNIGGGQFRPSSIYSAGPASVSRLTSRSASDLVMFSGSFGPKMQMRSDGGPIYRAAGGVAGLHPGAPRGTDTVPAWLTPGEYVIKRQAVDYYGQGALSAINSMKAPRTPVQNLANGSGGLVSGQTSGSPAVVALTPGTIQHIAQAVQPYLVVGDKVIAGANNRSATNSTTFGSN